MDYFIGLDIGTTNVKAVAFDRQGRVVAKASRGLTLNHPHPDWSEQDPEAVWAAFQFSVRRLQGLMAPQNGRLLAIGLSAAMHSLLLTDEQGKPLTPLLTWADNRAAEQAKDLQRRGYARQLVEQNGTPVHAMSPLCKILWWKNQPGLPGNQHYRIAGIKEWIWFRLFGEFAVDESLASATGLWDIRRSIWDEQLALPLAGLKVGQLPEVKTIFYALPIGDRMAGRLRVPQGTPVVLGSSDGCLANLGAGIFGPGAAALTVGTSGAVRITLDKPWTDPVSRLFCYKLHNTAFVAGGAVNNGGVALEWLSRNLGFSRGVAQLLAKASGCPAGAEGLLFLPYLLGERAPIYNPSARAVFFGLSHAHARPQLARAGVEGVTQALAEVFRILEQSPYPPQQVVAGGGLAQSAFWLQLLADMLGKPVAAAQTVEGSALGGAMVAAKSIGYFRDLPEGAAWVRQEALFKPDQDAHHLYREQAQRWRALYESVKDQF